MERKYLAQIIANDNDGLRMISACSAGAKVKVSDTSASTSVYGVFQTWDEDNDMNVVGLGTYVVRIHKDQTVTKGNLLVSNGDGTAKKQSDGIIRSKTIGKVLTNIKQETYSDGSYTVPCALYCG